MVTIDFHSIVYWVIWDCSPIRESCFWFEMGRVGFAIYVLQPMAVAANELRIKVLAGLCLKLPGMYVVKVRLFFAQLTAYDAVWIKVD